jgi:acetyl esterase/lipase
MRTLKIFGSLIFFSCCIFSFFLYQAVLELTPRRLEYSTYMYKDHIFGDFWKPEGKGPFPVVIVVHGGGWDGRDKSDMTRICRTLKKQGISAFNINYRLVPNYIYPAQIDDFKDAAKYLQMHQKELNIDIHKLGAWGYSAGSQIAALGAFQLEKELPFKAVIDGAGPLDLTLYPNNPLAIAYLGKTIKEDPEIYRTASPVYMSDKDSPPMFIYHSFTDFTVHFKHSEEMKENLEKNHIQAELHTAPPLGHYLAFMLSKESEKLAVKFLNDKFR